MIPALSLVFGGKKYLYMYSCRTKKDAREQARADRSLGFLVRVVRLNHPGGRDGQYKYATYARKQT